MITWTLFDLQVLTIATLSSIACALPGNFLLVKKMGLLGDAISHSVLPGIAIGFYLSGSRDSPLMFLLAVVSALLVVVVTKLIVRRTGTDQNAVLGAVFSIMFALGLVLIHEGAARVDLDPSCVLYGALELAPLDTIMLWGAHVPRSIPRLLLLIALNTTVIVLFYKELNVSAFDPDFAANVGIKTEMLNYLFIALVALTTVAVFELVGSILVIAMLIAPVAVARLMTRTLPAMIGVSVCVAVFVSVLGYYLAIRVPLAFGYPDTSAAGVMAALGGTLFFICAGVRYALSRISMHRAR